jgi:hypothetical protein
VPLDQLRRGAVAAGVQAFVNCQGTVQRKTQELLSHSLDNVQPLYDLEMQGGFNPGSRWGTDFATESFATGAQYARDMIYDAWLASAEAMVGYPWST